MRDLEVTQFRLLALEPAALLCEFHAFSSSGSNEVGLKLGHHCEHVEEELPDRIIRVVDRTGELQFDASLGQLVDDVASVGDRTRESVQLRHDQRVTFSARGESTAQSGPVAIGARQSVIGVDALSFDAQRFECLALNSEVLLVRRTSGVANQKIHGIERTVKAPWTELNRTA